MSSNHVGDSDFFCLTLVATFYLYQLRLLLFKLDGEFVRERSKMYLTLQHETVDPATSLLGSDMRDLPKCTPNTICRFRTVSAMTSYTPIYSARAAADVAMTSDSLRSRGWIFPTRNGFVIFCNWHWFFCFLVSVLVYSNDITTKEGHYVVKFAVWTSWHNNVIFSKTSAVTYHFLLLYWIE